MSRIYRLKEYSSQYPPRIMMYDPYSDKSDDHSWFFNWVKILPDKEDEDILVRIEYDKTKSSDGIRYKLLDGKEIFVSPEDVVIFPMNPDGIVNFLVMKRTAVYRIYDILPKEKKPSLLSRIKRGLLNLAGLNPE